MQFSAATIAAFIALSTDAVLALPSGQVTTLAKRITPPTSVNCGLGGISAPDYQNTMDAATRLTSAGGKCSTNAGSGTCERVACDNTTGIWMCNNDGHDGPFTADCATVASYVYGGEGETNSEVVDIFQGCKQTGMYSVNMVAGQAWDYRGGWNVIVGYANCNKASNLGPGEQ